ncbi:MAG: hypothetical protein HC837_13750 [Chloroflexaceae bacterium]|nr:hypothetical protein [Chloroflexaceae bacterium]
MSDYPNKHHPHPWEHLSPKKVLSTVVYDIYHHVSLLSSQLNRLVEDDDPISEEEYEAIFEQMQSVVRQLSKTVVNLKRYVDEQGDETVPDSATSATVRDDVANKLSNPADTE